MSTKINPMQIVIIGTIASISLFILARSSSAQNTPKTEPTVEYIYDTLVVVNEVRITDTIYIEKLQARLTKAKGTFYMYAGFSRSKLSSGINLATTFSTGHLLGLKFNYRTSRHLSAGIGAAYNQKGGIDNFAMGYGGSEGVNYDSSITNKISLSYIATMATLRVDHSLWGVGLWLEVGGYISKGIKGSIKHNVDVYEYNSSTHIERNWSHRRTVPVAWTKILSFDEQFGRHQEFTQLKRIDYGTVLTAGLSFHRLGLVLSWQAGIRNLMWEYLDGEYFRNSSVSLSLVYRIY